jgi:hypothetical protein
VIAKSPYRCGTEAAELGSEMVRLAARLILEEPLEGEADVALGRGYYARGAVSAAGDSVPQQLPDVTEGTRKLAAPSQTSDKHRRSEFNFLRSARDY